MECLCTVTDGFRFVSPPFELLKHIIVNVLYYSDNYHEYYCCNNNDYYYTNTQERKKKCGVCAEVKILCQLPLHEYFLCFFKVALNLVFLLIYAVLLYRNLITQQDKLSQTCLKHSVVLIIDYIKKIKTF